MTFHLSPKTLEVSYVFTNGAGKEACALLRPKLGADEQAHADRFLHTEDRVAFSVGRVLLRNLLSQYGAEPPDKWRLVQNAFGKPAIVRQPGTPDLRFNISHTKGVVVVAMALGRDVGVDVESLEHPVDFLDLARSHFSGVEVELIESLPEQRQRHAFFALWTLKEAYTKARGSGLSVPLSEFAFRLDPPAISFSSQVVDDPDRWFFWQDQLSPTHLMALAVQRCPAEELITCKRLVDLRQLYQVFDPSIR